MILIYMILYSLLLIITQCIINTKETKEITYIIHNNILSLNDLLHIINFYTAKSNKTLIIDTRNGGLGHSILSASYSVCYALSLKRHITCKDYLITLQIVYNKDVINKVMKPLLPNCIYNSSMYEYLVNLID